MVSCRFPHCTKPEPSIIYLLFNNVAQLVQSRLCLLHQDKLLFCEKHFNSWSTDNVQPDLGVDQSTFRLASHGDLSNLIVLKMK